MLSGLAWLGLEAKYLDPARRFYAETLDMTVRDRSGRPTPGDDRGESIAFAAGPTDLLLRRPTGLPRGGLHTHFALSIPSGEYDDWWDRLEDRGLDLEEFAFGSAKSLYCYDPDGNCVELGQRDVDGPGVDGVFEVALEVGELDAAEAFYAALGFETADRGEERRRVRMDGPMALELWEPQLGIADARGGVHVDLGFETGDLGAVVDAVESRACSIERTELEDPDGTREAVVVRDPDGHRLTVFG